MIPLLKGYPYLVRISPTLLNMRKQTIQQPSAVRTTSSCQPRWRLGSTVKTPINFAFLPYALIFPMLSAFSTSYDFISLSCVSCRLAAGWRWHENTPPGGIKATKKQAKFRKAQKYKENKKGGSDVRPPPILVSLVLIENVTCRGIPMHNKRDKGQSPSSLKCCSVTAKIAPTY